MRRLCLAAAACCALLTLPLTTARAQGPGRGGMMGGGGGAMLLMNPGVQMELKMGEEEVSKARALAEEVRGKMQEAMQELRDQGLAPEEMMSKMQELQRASTQQIQKDLGSFLKPEQVKRFSQIELQQRGLNAFMDPEVAKTLKVSDDQKAKLRSIADDMRGQMMDAFQNAGGDRQAMMAKMTTMRKEAMDKALALMTDDQKKAWKELTGEPFEVRFEGRPRG